MDVLQAIIIGIVQGLTEFLPISSSGHLVLVPEIMGVKSSLAFDTLLHVGTLVAVVTYFWSDIVHMIRSFISSLTDIPGGNFRNGIDEDPYKRLAWMVLIGTIPAGLAGVLFKDFFESLFSSITAVGFFLIVTGLLLWSSERISAKIREKLPVEKLGVRDSLIIGGAQALAIAPGISRSGATISAGLFLGFERELAARYSFLLSIPAILGAAIIQVKDISAGMDLLGASMIAGFVASAVSGYIAIKFLLKLIRERDLYVFAYYCFALGLLILGVSIL
ncbi:undecaprenyl-diphosphatase UppP [Methanothermobacter marburgensis]|uniref:Undecaprenyl-diphosphatase n=1 Tax=Methanothermobacter marburgensis (strain ATCC BAA-927 / DSM 2133 / JCM 14651 / NBRC 100331 / OCM 82 / Marburg) TaxID=79929 RepID=D9PYT3_METTM|nr:undecaprenyl-diphosphatase UppP [Methanothermobacter marburgensis]ADL57628.1 predicted undecaprenyl-diphosphatase [Methanothermobacter marburgensis str. Marburg]WBF09863.1 undecaprenyl-diphosphatase UppP [Methanothermobacter marburgensis]